MMVWDSAHARPLAVDGSYYLTALSQLNLAGMYPMKIAGGQTEEGIVIGNTYDKYGTSNPVARAMVQGFDKALTRLVDKVAADDIHEVGCGEGYWVTRWVKEGRNARGTDFSSQVIAMAQRHAEANAVDASRFEVRSIYEVDEKQDSAPLVVCCEVMEHLEEPGRGLASLQRIVQSDLILSVPREPLWRVLNMARGKYIGALGNTPGHLNHWSKTQFVTFVGKYFDVVETLSPLPWTMLHCRRR